jgi:hypothetical protein
LFTKISLKISISSVERAASNGLHVLVFSIHCFLSPYFF